MIESLVKARAAEKKPYECCIYADTERVGNDLNMSIIIKGNAAIECATLAKIIEKISDRTGIPFDDLLYDIKIDHKVGSDFAMKATIEEGIKKHGDTGE